MQRSAVPERDEAIHRDVLAWALQSQDEEHWFDPRTGEVWSDPSLSGEEVQEHWISIQPIPSREAWQDRADFVDEVATGAMQQRLLDALAGRGAFSRFKRVLMEEDDLLQKWYAFEKARMDERVEEWLADHGVEVAEPRT